MSASERLAALDAAMHFDMPSDRATFVAGRDAEHAVLKALPEIVAVVRAAEDAGPEPALIRPLRAALAALDAKLGGEG